jgi:arylsulfatase A-like enzyme
MKPASNSSRRDFLKLTALAPALLSARPLIKPLNLSLNPDAPNVLVFVFDAWTAHNLQLHGYPRRTMPNMERFAARATVYHNHYSAGSFTVPGTASLLTGLYPWNHRAVQLSGGGVAKAHEQHHMFAAFGQSHSNLGYAQNPFADIFLYQFRKHLDTYLAEGEFNAERRRLSTLPIFQNDAQIAFASIENNIIRNGKGYSGSLFLGLISRISALLRFASTRKANIKRYPRGLPIAGGIYFLDDVVDGTIEALGQIASPTAAYFHFFPPHEPYAPSADYARAFDDGWEPPDKPYHPLSRARHPREEMLHYRLLYDQFMAAWDAEIGRLLDYLESSGLMEKSIVVFTSDHGELFERGEIGHNTLVFSDPVIHVPLLVSAPGQTERKDIHAVTTSVDVLPTLAHLAGSESPAWTDGALLPGLGGVEDTERSVYSLDAKMCSSFSAFTQFSMSLVKRRHRLIYYRYPSNTIFELYNLDEDPEELNDLFPSGSALAKEMKEEILQKVEDFNRPYHK